MIRAMRLSIGLAILVALSACLGRGEAVPRALQEYLDDLVEGRLDEAFERTQLGELEAFTRGGAVTRDHFEAFYARSPLLEYRIDRVVRLDRRDPNAPAEQGTPEWDVVVQLTYPYGVVEESFAVLGAVLGRVMVEPVPLDLRVEGIADVEISVDGVPVDVSESAVGQDGSTWRIVVINGRHELGAGAMRVIFAADPLEVVEGPGRAQGNPSSAKPQMLIVET